MQYDYLLSAPILHVVNFSTNDFKLCEVDCPCVFPFHMTIFEDPDYKEILEFYADVEETTLSLFLKLELLKKRFK